jgi:hypothetical protein
MKRTSLWSTLIFTWLLGAMLLFSINKGDSYAYWTEACSIAVMWVPWLLDRLNLISLPYPVILCSSIALLLHSTGLVVNFYNTIPWWDTLTHFSSGIVVALLVTIVLMIVITYSTYVKIPGVWVPFLIVISVIAFEGSWEILEYTVDQIMRTVMQQGIEDTIGDIMTSTISGIVVGIGAAYCLQKVSIDSLVSGMNANHTVQILKRRISK